MASKNQEYWTARELPIYAQTLKRSGIGRKAEFGF
jgi:hypothetical protein